MRSPRSEVAELLRRISALDVGDVRLMEVCGTHTMAIAKSGIKSLLPRNIRLISGPGCPVCVTPAARIDDVLRLSERSDVLIATYGDMIRVPGSRQGDHLALRRARGAQVEIVYSPFDALRIAQERPDRQVVFLGVGFETTAPGTAAVLTAAAERGCENFTVLSMLKTVEPALRALRRDPAFDIQGLLCPGHVATILGEQGFRFVPDGLGLPAVISGFEPEDILVSVYRLLRQIADGTPRLENEYTRAVRPEGNPMARAMIERCFAPCDDLWRGLGHIPQSGLQIRPAYAQFDARVRFELPPAAEDEAPTACRCGDVIRGHIAPRDCPLFGRVCLPEEPVGPCMVSSEGACAAAYKYQEG